MQKLILIRRPSPLCIAMPRLLFHVRAFFRKPLTRYRKADTYGFILSKYCQTQGTAALFIHIPPPTVLLVTVSHIGAMTRLGYKKTAMRNPNRKIPWTRVPRLSAGCDP